MQRFMCVRVLILLGAAALPCRAQACVDTAGFVRVSGKDTLIVERVVLAVDGVWGLQRSDDGITRYHVAHDDLLGDTSVTVELWERGRALSAAPTQVGTLALHGASARFTVRSDVREQVQVDTLLPGTVVLLDVAVGLEEALIRRARATRATSLDIPVYYVASGGYRPSAHLSFVGADSATLRIGDVEAQFRIDSVGRVLGGRYDTPGTETVWVRREPCAVIDGLLSAHR
jgi:hypothetical protein